jgi:hypothetical protein
LSQRRLLRTQALQLFWRDLWLVHGSTMAVHYEGRGRSVLSIDKFDEATAAIDGDSAMLR